MGAARTWVQPVLAFQYSVISVIDIFFFYLLIGSWRKAGGWPVVGNSVTVTVAREFCFTCQF